ncbi:MAG: decaprenyl-phosphate phosphoribosyltransferase [Candidatus Liptonbacteria bacterium]|nr:decaprenyl-phosphate phosphoribosyltransferase [Candidatus Liptonbacteria bacterium]
MLKQILISLRVRHWFKNLLVFTPLVFARHFFESHLFFQAALIFVLFSLLASGIYLWNDIFDRKEDALHPRKRLRPVASGQLSALAAGGASTLLLTGALLGGLFFSPDLFFVFAGYLVLQFFYTALLRRVVILDVFLVAFGFVLRVYAGALPFNIPVSHWLVSSVFVLALLLVFAKRYQEIKVLAETAAEHRATLGRYDLQLLNAIILVCAATVLVSYLLYTADPATVAKFGTVNLIYTAPFVFFGIFRFLYHLYRGQIPDNPLEIIFRDGYLLGAVLLWGLSVLLLIYH